MNPLLEIRDLEVTFNTDEGSFKAVDGVNLEVGRGETLALVGESGCGKTMLSLSLMGLLPWPGKISKGTIIFDGKDLTNFSEAEMRNVRGPGMSMIFQDPLSSLNPVFSIKEQLVRPLIVHGLADEAEALKKSIEMLDRAGIAGADKRIEEFPHQFSGGQRQRIMIAAALSLSPLLLIADEPTTALDVSIQAQILELLKGLKKDFNTSMIFISHNLGIVSGIAERVAVMYSGWIVEEADLDKIFNNPLHPYTKALLKAIPSIEGEKEPLQSLPGSPPVAGEVIEGCRLHPRCPEKIEGICDRNIPGYFSPEEGRRVRCVLYSEEFNKDIKKAREVES